MLQFGSGAALCVLIYLLLLNFPPVARDSPTRGLIPVLGLAIGTSILTAVFLRADALSPTVLGLAARQRPFSRLAIGFLAGSALAGCWFLIVTAAMNVSWRLNPEFAAWSLLIAGLFAFFNNLGEELIYRGYAFTRLAERCGEGATVVITSSIFALLHLQAGLPWLSVLAGVFTSGLVFGAVFARWRSLPLALGMHVATNVVQEASGLRPSLASMIAPVQSSIPAATESAVLACVAAVNLAVALGILLIRRGPRQG